MMSDDILDLAAAITERLVFLGIIPDCMDTDSMAEFDAQDAIEAVITEFCGEL